MHPWVICYSSRSLNQPENLCNPSSDSLTDVTADCVDPANFCPKPKSANPKAVQMNLIMWLQLSLGFPFFDTTWMQLLTITESEQFCCCCFFFMEYRDYLGYSYPYQYPSGPSAVPHAIPPNQRSPVHHRKSLHSPVLLLMPLILVCLILVKLD